MAIKATATITLSCVVDIKSTTRYYKLQASTLAKPTKPTVKNPSGWTTTEPAYTDGSTNSLYFCDMTEYNNGTVTFSDVSLSSSYEAAKSAYNKATTAQSGVNVLKTYIRESDAGIEVGKAGGKCKALVNANGSFDVLDKDGNTISSFKGDKIKLGRADGTSEIFLGDNVTLTSIEPEAYSDPFDRSRFLINTTQDITINTYTSGNSCYIMLTPKIRDGSATFKIGNARQYIYGRIQPSSTDGTLEIKFKSVEIAGKVTLGSKMVVPNNASFAGLLSDGTESSLAFMSTGNHAYFGYSSPGSARTGNSILSANNGEARLQAGNGKDSTYIGMRYHGGTSVFTLEPQTTAKGMIGNTTNYFYRFYASTAQWTPSDKRLKKNIKEFDKRFEDMFMDMRAVTYELKAHEGQNHCGMIAQEIEESMKKHGISEKEFGFFEYDKEKDRYGLSYPELIALNTHMIQKTVRENEELKKENAELKARLEKLEKAVFGK